MQIPRNETQARNWNKTKDKPEHQKDMLISTASMFGSDGGSKANRAQQIYSRDQSGPSLTVSIVASDVWFCGDLDHGFKAAVAHIIVLRPLLGWNNPLHQYPGYPFPWSRHQWSPWISASEVTMLAVPCIYSLSPSCLGFWNMRWIFWEWSQSRVSGFFLLSLM